jgi:hypothetical protein
MSLLEAIEPSAAKSAARMKEFIWCFRCPYCGWEEAIAEAPSSQYANIVAKLHHQIAVKKCRGLLTMRCQKK